MLLFPIHLLDLLTYLLMSISLGRNMGWRGSHCLFERGIIGQISLETTLTYSITPFVYIGRDNYDDRYFNGVIRDVRIWVWLIHKQIQEGCIRSLQEMSQS